MKTLIYSLATALLLVPTALEAANGDTAPKDMTPEERKAYHDKMAMEKHGGFVTVKGTPSGSIVVLNAQNRVAVENFDITKYTVCKWLDGLVTVKEGDAATVANADALKKQLKADFAVFIVDDPALPPSLVAVEAKWAILNVGALAVGNANEEIVRIRAKNEFSRVFAMLCGGFCSQYPAPLMNMVTEISDLDKCLADPPGDVGTRMKGYLERNGVQAERKMLYRKAVLEGWAPAPTNEFQKAVWEQVKAEQNEKPSNPIRIRPGQKPSGK